MSHDAASRRIVSIGAGEEITALCIPYSANISPLFPWPSLGPSLSPSHLNPSPPRLRHLSSLGNATLSGGGGTSRNRDHQGFSIQQSNGVRLYTRFMSVFLGAITGYGSLRMVPGRSCTSTTNDCSRARYDISRGSGMSGRQDERR